MRLSHNSQSFKSTMTVGPAKGHQCSITWSIKLLAGFLCHLLSMPARDEDSDLALRIMNPGCTSEKTLNAR